MTSDYQNFLAAKIALPQAMGFRVEKESLHPLLLPHQADLVQWALMGTLGRCAQAQLRKGVLDAI